MKNIPATHQQKEHAKLLYTRHDHTIPDIALIVETDEATVRHWVQDGGWNGMKRSELTSKAAQIERYYTVIEYLDSKIKSDEEINIKHADLITKYTACISNLKDETTVTEILDVAEPFILWLRRQDPELTKIVSVELDNFVKQRLAPPIA